MFRYECDGEIRVGLVQIFVFKQKTAYELRIRDWSSDVCSSDLRGAVVLEFYSKADLRIARAERDTFILDRIEAGITLYRASRDAPLARSADPFVARPRVLARAIRRGNTKSSSAPSWRIGPPSFGCMPPATVPPARRRPRPSFRQANPLPTGPD